MAERAALIQTERDGLHCRLGGFHIDPWRPVPRAVITHAHADHARAGCGEYWCTPGTAALLRHRIGPNIVTRELPYGEVSELQGTRLSLHPAGHVLGSAQARVEAIATGEVWVASGDYKAGHGCEDRTCTPFEVVACDTFITETTFALPIYRWIEAARIAEQINSWWRRNAEAGRTSLLMTYSLGKAQRVLSMLDPSIGPIGAHGAVTPINAIYRERGIDLPECVHATKESAALLRGAGLIIAPPSVGNTTWPRGFTGPGGMQTAFASGWMTVRGRRRWTSVDTGFVLSDHADWNGLLETIAATGASRVLTTHGSAEVFARYLREEQGLNAQALQTRYTGEQSDETATPSGHGTPNHDAEPESAAKGERS